MQLGHWREMNLALLVEFYNSRMNFFTDTEKRKINNNNNKKPSGAERNGFCKFSQVRSASKHLFRILFHHLNNGEALKGFYFKEINVIAVSGYGEKSHRKQREHEELVIFFRKRSNKGFGCLY